jgi:hypothetical protein
MSIHEHLPPQARRELKEVGWTKGLELAKVARRDGQEFDCATWLHKARSLPVIEQAIETAALMLGSDKSRGYCLEMICADFLAGANLDNGDPGLLLRSIRRFYKFLSSNQREEFLAQLDKRES